MKVRGENLRVHSRVCGAETLLKSRGGGSRVLSDADDIGMLANSCLVMGSRIHPRGGGTGS